jgi:hypothetical protein
MRTLALEAAGALGLRASAAHVEFALTDNGPRLLEVGTRPGGHRCHMLWKAHGIDLVSAYLAVKQSKAPTVDTRWARPVALVTPFPRATGRYRGIRAIERVTTLASYRRHSLYPPPGGMVGSAAEGYWQVMSIELEADDMPPLEADVRRIAGFDHLILIEPPEGERRHAAAADHADRNLPRRGLELQPA